MVFSDKRAALASAALEIASSVLESRTLFLGDMIEMTAFYGKVRTF